MKRLIALAAVGAALLITACGDGGRYVDEANGVCEPAGGVISYSHGGAYDVVVCKDGRAHEIPGRDE